MCTLAQSPILNLVVGGHMSELFLIAHKVRNEPAFDIAIHMECPHCNGIALGDYGEPAWCHECDGLGYWWIIPTSGHRAFPYWNSSLNSAVDWEMQRINDNPMIEMPVDLRDHYTTTREATKSLVDMLGIKPKKLPPLVRRL